MTSAARTCVSRAFPPYLDTPQPAACSEDYMQKNPVCYWELASHDAEATVEFLKKVFA